MTFNYSPPRFRRVLCGAVNGFNVARTNEGLWGGGKDGGDDMQMFAHVRASGTNVCQGPR